MNIKMNKYWRLKRDDDELDAFVDFLKSSINYIEKSRRDYLYPSKVSHYDSMGNKINEKVSIIITLTTSRLLNVSDTFSTGFYTDENGDTEVLSIKWVEDNEKKIIDFSKKWLRKEKLNQINSLK